ncbi:hypothetical protein [Ralstonia solanacearum]|uniref:Hypothetical transmembrane protein n=1 Tax=Ralstonia solanacearum (strain Po82) TaxID=1031711 RepID=F6G5D6_RALS8|nr:hypothetical protein [Ralstonia solanacearum]AEG70237.1 hypothetical transmembrane protein [Ralstonia solanacearum Po82]AMP68365.1 hypothetical protein UW163_02175 [Ralstonia solanacearum]AMP74727.1 hypothetical protein RALBFv3_11400 [Ralstonia solanacearum]AYB61650.1 hypothetical protein C2124_14385 [Ralstonia solanacearum]MBB6585443.1 hypothetical protein [Ralstonia solanacearum]
MIRTLVAGLAGGLTLNVAMLLTFRLIGFGWRGGGFLLTSPIQSRKLIAVWTQLEPLPLIVANPAPMIAGLMLFGVAHAAIYGWLAPAWPPGIVSRALRFAGLMFVLSYLFFEFFTPVNLLGEPLMLVLAELGFRAVIALAQACVIAAVMEPRAAVRRAT